MSAEQQAVGEKIAIARDGGTAIVNVFEGVPPQPTEAAERERAERLLAALPLDAVPEPAVLPAGSRLPFRPNRHFVGREADFRQLAAWARAGGAAAIGQVATATGLDGIGKTQFAVEFACRYGRFFAGGVHWLSCERPEDMPTEVARCGEAMGVAGDRDVQVRGVLAVWQSGLPRLVVLDNCEDEETLARWLPPAGGARVLVTSRRTGWSGTLVDRMLSLGVLSRGESIALLRQFREDLAADDADLDAIADTLGDLPLALHMAGSHLARYRHAGLGRPSAYLAALMRSDLLEHPSLQTGQWSPTGHELSVARTFALGMDRLDPADPGDGRARFLLDALACCAPGEPVPRWLLARAARQGEPGVDETAVEDAVARLEGLGLIETERDGALSLHRLLRAFVAGQKDAGRAREALEAAAAAAAREQNEAGLPAAVLAWQVHLHAIAETAAARESGTASTLLDSLGCHLGTVADWQAARDAHERALQIDEAAFGPDHPEVATGVNNLGGVLHDLGDLAAARDAFQRALAILEKHLGPEHPSTRTVRRNLGGLSE